MNKKEPYFIGIGVPKSGSTWFMRILKTHPQIFTTERKEPHFFSNDELFKSGLDNYLKLYKNINENQVAGEFSTKYLRKAEKVSPRIKKIFPNTKLICILRNPVERSNSHFNWLKQLGKIDKTLSIKEAIKINKGIVNFSKYSNGLKIFLKDFSKDNILILKTEDLKNKPAEVFSDVINFLNIDHYKFNFEETSKSETIIPKFILLEKIRTYSHQKIRDFNQDWIFNTQIANIFSKFYRNFNSNPKKNFKLNLSEKRYLANIFKEDLSELQNITDLDLSDWGEYPK